MEDSSQDLPLKQSGEEGPAEPERPRNRTPLFKLSAVLPEFAAEARRVLIKWGETALANQVDDLWIPGNACGPWSRSVFPPPTEPLRRGLRIAGN